MFYLMLSLVLHPRHKLQYFKNAGWSDEWIVTAKALVREEFDRSYAPVGADIARTPIEVCMAVLKGCDNF